jgi:hypothetical protein
VEQVKPLTVRALAESIRPRADEDGIAFVSRRIRHWTLAGALDTIGEARSGVGRHRRYARETAYFAAVLDALADLGLPIDALKKVGEQLRNWYREDGYARRGWDYALAGKGTVYLWTEVSLSSGDPDRDWVRVSIEDEKSLERRKGRLPMDAAVLLNLTAAFKRVAAPEVL